MDLGEAAIAGIKKIKEAVENEGFDPRFGHEHFCTECGKVCESETVIVDEPIGYNPINDSVAFERFEVESSDCCEANVVLITTVEEYEKLMKDIEE